MFEKEIKFIVDFNLNKVRKSGTFFTLDKLSSAGIHPSILKYISAELDLMIFEDRQRLLNNSMFDYSGSDISKYFSMIAREIKRNKRIEFEDLKKLVIQAVSFNANHVVRPRWSLSKLIFDPSPTRSVEEIQLILEYPYYYGYSKNILLSYLNKKKVTSLGVDEFERVYSRIDDELFASGNTRLVENALSSMSDFFNEGAAVKDRLSPELVLVFLKEKGLTEQSFRLKQSIVPDGKQKYNLSELGSILFGTAPEESPEQQVKESTQKTKPSEIKIEESPEEIINSSDQTPEVKSQPEDTFVKVVSSLPFKEGELEIEEDEDIPDSDNIILKSEEEVAEDINLPIVEDVPVQTIDKVKAIDEITQKPGIPAPEINIDREAEITLPDDEIKEIYNEEPETELSPDKVITDQDEIRFDYEAGEKLDELYEFETDKEQNDQPGADEFQQGHEFNLNELENELKQIEEEFNIPADSSPQRKPVPVDLKKSSGKDIFKILSDREVDRIINNIFNDDRDDFTNTLERISECKSYEESTEILKSVFLTYRINPYSRDAVTLTNAVSKYFDKK